MATAKKKIVESVDKSKNIMFTAVVVAIIALIMFLSYLFPTGRVANSISTSTQSELADVIAQKQTQYPLAVELVKPNYYHNLPVGESNITIQSLIGKRVILVDFWTYSCINCQRTLPYLNSWYDKYRNEGLEIVSIHTPEFEFEKDPANVENAIAQYKIKYPVVQDNNYQTWRAYNNRYWPRKYLIDIDGFIVYDHIGEGGYAETEHKIQDLLEERAIRLNQTIVEQNMTTVADEPSFREIQTPELYAGYTFDRGQLGNKEGRSPNSVVDYSIPDTLTPNLFYLGGKWLNGPEAMVAGENGAQIKLTYTAKKLHIVLGANNSDVLVSIDNGVEKKINVNGQQLYTLDDAETYGTRTALITVPAGVSFYTFTFG